MALQARPACGSNLRATLTRTRPPKHAWNSTPSIATSSDCLWDEAESSVLLVTEGQKEFDERVIETLSIFECIRGDFSTGPEPCVKNWIHRVIGCLGACSYRYERATWVVNERRLSTSGERPLAGHAHAAPFHPTIR